MSEPITVPEPGAPCPVPGVTTSEPSPTPRRCRSLTVSGLQCRARALRGHHLCVAHVQYRFPVCPKGPRVTIPLLENLDTIQVVATQVAQGLFAETLDPHRAGKILYACQIAVLTLPRPARLQPADKPALPQAPVSDVFPSVDGALLGPNLPWSADQIGFEPVWSYHKHLYESECERQGKPKPAGPDDFPASGWLTPDEVKEYNQRPKELAESFWEPLLGLRIEADQRGELPPLKERSCAYFTYGRCDGPTSDRPCEFCYREREEHLRLPPREEPAPQPGPAAGDIGDLQAVAQDASQTAPERSRFTPAWRERAPVVKLDNSRTSRFFSSLPHPQPGGMGSDNVPGTP